jgi:hypothetical protein
MKNFNEFRVTTEARNYRDMPDGYLELQEAQDYVTRALFMLNKASTANRQLRSKTQPLYKSLDNINSKMAKLMDVELGQ